MSRIIQGKPGEYYGFQSPGFMHRQVICSNVAMLLIMHYSDVIMGSMSSQITGVSIVCATACSSADQRKHQCSASRAPVRGIHRWPVISLHEGPVTRSGKCFYLMTSSCKITAWCFLWVDILCTIACWRQGTGHLKWMRNLVCPHARFQACALHTDDQPCYRLSHRACSVCYLLPRGRGFISPKQFSTFKVQICCVTAFMVNWFSCYIGILQRKIQSNGTYFSHGVISYFTVRK